MPTRAVAVFLVTLQGLLLFTSGEPDPFFGFLRNLNGNGNPRELRVDNLEYSDCSGQDIITLANLSATIDDNHIRIIGSLIVGQEISSLSVNMKFRYRNMIDWPCTNGIGSCSYNDVCDMLNANTDRCRTQMETYNLNLPCQCPIPPDTYNLDLQLPIPDRFKSLMTGQHIINIRGSTDGQEILCYVLKIKVSM